MFLKPYDFINAIEPDPRFNIETILQALNSGNSNGEEMLMLKEAEPRFFERCEKFGLEKFALLLYYTSFSSFFRGCEHMRLNMYNFLVHGIANPFIELEVPKDERISNEQNLMQFSLQIYLEEAQKLRRIALGKFIPKLLTPDILLSRLFDEEFSGITHRVTGIPADITDRCGVIEMEKDFLANAFIYQTLDGKVIIIAARHALKEINNDPNKVKFIDNDGKKYPIIQIIHAPVKKGNSVDIAYLIAAWQSKSSYLPIPIANNLRVGDKVIQLTNIAGGHSHTSEALYLIPQIGRISNVRGKYIATTNRLIDGGCGSMVLKYSTTLFGGKVYSLAGVARGYSDQEEGIQTEPTSYQPIFNESLSPIRLL